MTFATNRKRHQQVSDPVVASEVESNRARFRRGEATITLEEMLYSIEHPGTAAKEDKPARTAVKFAVNESF